MGNTNCADNRMKILVEDYQYDAALVRDVLHGVDALQNVEGKISLTYV